MDNNAFTFSNRLDEKNHAVIVSSTVPYGGSEYGRLIVTVHVPRAFRGQRHGSALLKKICENADELGVELFVNAIPYDDSKLGQFDLVCWYERYGFTSFGGILRRTPQEGTDKVPATLKNYILQTQNAAKDIQAAKDAAIAAGYKQTGPDEFMKTVRSQDEIKQEMDRLFADALAKPSWPVDHKLTPERKAYGDKRVAENIRFHFLPTQLNAYTDAQLADIYEEARNDNDFDPNFSTENDKMFYLEMLHNVHGMLATEATFEPGEHQEVLDAIEQHNTGESE